MAAKDKMKSYNEIKALVPGFTYKMYEDLLEIEAYIGLKNGTVAGNYYPLRTYEEMLSTFPDFTVAEYAFYVFERSKGLICDIDTYYRGKSLS